MGDPDAAPIRVPAGFEREFPGASRSAAESAANLVRTTDALMHEYERRRRRIADLSASAFEALAILEGANEPLAGHVVAERLLVSSASTTSLLDTLERRGLVERHKHPDDRRKVLIHITAAGRSIVDEMLPVVHGASAEAFSCLSEADREQLIRMVSTLRAHLVEIAASPPATPKPRRRPRR